MSTVMALSLVRRLVRTSAPFTQLAAVAENAVEN